MKSIVKKIVSKLFNLLLVQREINLTQRVETAIKHGWKQTETANKLYIHYDKGTSLISNFCLLTTKCLFAYIPF